MTGPLAFKCCYSDWKLIRTRQTVQIIFEIPLEQADAAYQVLGGMPDSARENWFAVAAIQVPQAKEAPARPDHIAPKPDRAKPGKRDWRDLPYSQQAGIRINEPTFAAYLREEHPDEWHETGDADACLKLICNIDSKTDLATKPKAATLWFQVDGSYQAWLAKERVGA